MIQQENKEQLQNENTRKTKAATSAIHLLHNAQCPAVLVECGFLSNPEEAARFEGSEYRQKVAFVLFSAITEFLN
jgi:N-acetylmuramoyl-L-alanine amidase